MFKRSQRGAVAPLIALMLFVIIICVALVVDLGRVHSVKAELQRTVDAAALAGVRYLPNETSATNVSTATAGQSRVDGRLFQDLLDDEEVVFDVVFGKWDPNLTDADGNVLTHEERFDQSTTVTDAVYVRATHNVDHVFFFFTDSTPVTADAIAVQEPINPVIPLTVTSCIPLASMQNDPGKIPGTTECDIGYFRFNVNGIDTAAWTGLTFGHDVNNITDILSQEEQRQLFEQIVFGTNSVAEANQGIENTAVSSSNSPVTTACSPVDLNIPCGLGPIAGFSQSLAPPSAFQSIVPNVAGTPGTDLPVDATGGYWVPDPNFDPLYDYPSLPRWYNINNSPALQKDDHFTRVWTLDGLLVIGPEEQNVDISTFPNAGSVDISTYSPETRAFGAYQTRLKSYYNNPNDPNIVPAPFADGRMASLIETDSELDNAVKSALYDQFGLNNQNARRAFRDNFGLIDLYFPDFHEIVRRAGYPSVGVNNGSATTLMGTFLDNAGVVADENNSVLNCAENDPLNGVTLRVQVPVIFTGFCETWQALANPSGNWNLYYVGLADLLITRIWKNPKNFDCGGTYVYLDTGSGSCSASDFNPTLSAGNFSAVNSNTMAIEGLFKIPQVDTDEAASLVRVYLVE